jgi:uncharacterized protein (TIGR02186 family)
MRISRSVSTIFLAVFLAWICQGVAAAQGPLAVIVSPSNIAIGTTYNGGDVSVSGTLPKDAEVLIRVRGKRGGEHFKKKGKAFNFLWMNMGTVEMNNVPSLMLLAPSDELVWLMTHKPETWQQMGLGFEALKRELEITPDGQDRQMLVDEFLKLKKHDGVYGIQPRTIHYEEKGTAKAFHANVHLPSALLPGVYTLETFAIRDGQVLARDEQPIEAKMIGMPAFLSDLAYGHGLLYGVLAVLVAIGAGLLIGYLFKGDGGGGH